MNGKPLILSNKFLHSLDRAFAFTFLVSEDADLPAPVLGSHRTSCSSSSGRPGSALPDDGTDHPAHLLLLDPRPHDGTTRWIKPPNPPPLEGFLSAGNPGTFSVVSICRQIIFCDPGGGARQGGGRRRRTEREGGKGARSQTPHPLKSLRGFLSIVSICRQIISVILEGGSRQGGARRRTDLFKPPNPPPLEGFCFWKGINKTYIQ